MATISAGTDSGSRAIVAESAASCLRSFQECLQVASLIHPRELSLVDDQLARFSAWTANIRVFASGRASLDHRLREAPDVQGVVIGLLRALAIQIRICSRWLRSLGSEEYQKLKEPLVKIHPKFDQSIQDIGDEISLLHKFSNSIVRASMESENHKAAAESYRIRDDEGNDIEAHLTGLTLNQIRDQFPKAEETILQRLADTIVLRRKRILYGRSRYGNTAIRPQQIPPQPQVIVTVPGQTQTTENPSESAIRSLTQQSATTLAPDAYRKASAPSEISASTTVPLSNHDDLVFPRAPLGRIKQKYNELRALRKEALETEYGRLPVTKQETSTPVVETEAHSGTTPNNDWRDSVKAIGEVTCPFCFYALPAQDVVDDKKWMLHVEDDLGAYLVCMFKDCNSPHELYDHSSTWLAHMRGHAMRWRCTSKYHGEVICESKDEYLSHMKTAHPGKFSDAQLQALAKRIGRVMGPLFKSCPLCGKDKVDGTMDDHVVGHLRFLALKFLPPYEDEGAEISDSEEDSTLPSGPQSRSTIRDDLKTPLQVTFDDTGGLERRPDPSVKSTDEPSPTPLPLPTASDPISQPATPSLKGNQTLPYHSVSPNQQ